MKSHELSEQVGILLEARSAVDSGVFEPTAFKLDSDRELGRLEMLLAGNSNITVIDPVRGYANEMFELDHPDLARDSESRADYVEGVVSEGVSFGTWFYTEWDGKLTRYADKDDHYRLLTARRHPLRTPEEQIRVRGSANAVIGLSVGSNIALELVQEGIGETIVTGEMDRISPTNLNRMRASVKNVGTEKIIHIARTISEINPYLQQIHYKNGVSSDNLPEIMSLVSGGGGVVFEEIDNLPMKAAVRQAASAARVPLLMVTDAGDYSAVDIERHDIDTSPRFFDGRVDDETTKRLLDGQVRPDELMEIKIAMAGEEIISERLLAGALMASEGQLAGIPQLGSTARLGAALGVKYAEAIMVGEDVPSGQYLSKPIFYPGKSEEEGSN